jgi:hypothetical protein
MAEICARHGATGCAGSRRLRPRREAAGDEPSGAPITSVSAARRTLRLDDRVAFAVRHARTVVRRERPSSLWSCRASRRPNRRLPPWPGSRPRPSPEGRSPRVLPMRLATRTSIRVPRVSRARLSDPRIESLVAARATGIERRRNVTARRRSGSGFGWRGTTPSGRSRPRVAVNSRNPSRARRIRWIRSPTACA